MPTYKDENGTVWMVNLIDVTELPEMYAGTVADWLDLDREPHVRSGRVDDVWYPIVGEDAEQVSARCGLLKNGKMTGTRNVRIKGRRGLP